MTTKIEHIELKPYELIDSLNDESDALDSFADHSGYICDAISATADDYIPIYNSDIWANASDISEHIEQAISEGIAPTEGEVDLIKIFQAGYYVYYQESLYNNIDTLIFNYVADKVNDHLSTLESVDGIDTGEIESEIESACENLDNNNTFDDMDDIVNGIVERIDEGEFQEE